MIKAQNVNSELTISQQIWLYKDVQVISYPHYLHFQFTKFMNRHQVLFWEYSSPGEKLSLNLLIKILINKFHIDNLTNSLHSGYVHDPSRRSIFIFPIPVQKACGRKPLVRVWLLPKDKLCILLPLKTPILESCSLASPEQLKTLIITRGGCQRPIFEQNVQSWSLQSSLNIWSVCWALSKRFEHI